MKYLHLILLSIIALDLCEAQTFTPNTGETYSLHELYIEQPYVLAQGVEDEYLLSSDLTISPNDVLLINDLEILWISPDVLLTIQGELHTNGSSMDDPVIIKAESDDNPFQGIRIEEGAIVSINNTVISRGGGIKVLTTDFNMTNSVVEYQSEGASTGGAISFARGNPLIDNSTFYMNDLPAVSTGANQSVGLTIQNCHIEYNSQLNENRPQINIGASGTDGIIHITGNEIIGDRTKEMVGGIAVANFYGNSNTVDISQNIIRHNRYGITLYGANDVAIINGNTIEDNNTQDDPMQGGSGINLYSQGDIINTNTIIKNNSIRRNLWGITLQGNAFANLGDESNESPCANVFSENGNNGVTYALYNNTENNLIARQNCWIEGVEYTSEMIEAVIFHYNDDETLGLVDYINAYCNLGVVEDNANDKVKLYPNPSKYELNIHTTETGILSIYNAFGINVKRLRLEVGLNRIHHQLPKGVYFINIQFGNYIQMDKLIVK